MFGAGTITDRQDTTRPQLGGTAYGCSKLPIGYLGWRPIHTASRTMVSLGTLSSVFSVWDRRLETSPWSTFVERRRKAMASKCGNANPRDGITFERRRARCMLFAFIAAPLPRGAIRSAPPAAGRRSRRRLHRGDCNVSVGVERHGRRWDGTRSKTRRPSSGPATGPGSRRGMRRRWSARVVGVEGAFARSALPCPCHRDERRAPGEQPRPLRVSPFLTTERGRAGGVPGMGRSLRPAAPPPLRERCSCRSTREPEPLASTRIGRVSVSPESTARGATAHRMSDRQQGGFGPAAAGKCNRGARRNGPSHKRVRCHAGRTRHRAHRQGDRR